MTLAENHVFPPSRSKRARWGDENSDHYVRIVFSNEPIERLEELGEQVENALL